MHFKNGREAKSGDKVLNLVTGETGLLHSLSTQSETCNGRLAKFNPNDSYVTISDCLHLDDIVATGVPDSSKL